MQIQACILSFLSVFYKATNMRKQGLIAASCALALISMHAGSQSHQHGHGEVVIAQDGKAWEVQMTLPSADVFGFEHEPENKKERAKFDAQLTRLKQSASVLQLPAGCKLETYDIDPPFSEHDEDHHENEHDDYGNDDYSEDEHHEHDEHEAHSDVEVSIEMTCKQAPSDIVFTVFSLSDSISELLVQWATDKGQGSRELTPTNTRLVF
jgi:hypothetical protein